MKYTFLLLLFVLNFSISSYCQPKNRISCNFPFDNLQVEGEAKERNRSYLLDGKPYSGCAKQTFENQDRYWIYLIENGKLQRQVGYYSNGQMCRDFEFIDGVEHGHTIMYRQDGSVYVDESYRYGLLHGTSFRYYENGQLAREAEYVNGELTRERLFNQDGSIKEN